MKTYVLDPRVARRLEERAEVSLVDAKEFEGGGEGNNDTNDDTNALVGNIEGLNPKGAETNRCRWRGRDVERVCGDETGRVLDVDNVERRRRNTKPFSIAILPGSYDHLNMKESPHPPRSALLAEKTAKANGEFTVQDVEVIRQTVRKLKECRSTLCVVDALLASVAERRANVVEV